MKRGVILVYLKLLATATFWGGAFVAGRYLAPYVKPFSAGFIRFASASILLAIVSWHRDGRLKMPAPRHILPLVLLGLTGIFAYNVFFFQGLRLINAGRASSIIAMNPVFIALFSALLFKEKLSMMNVLGVLVSVAGAVIVVSMGRLNTILGHGIGRGELMMFGCVASWVTYSLLSKKVMVSLSPLSIVFYSCVVGSICFLPLACAERIWEHILHYPPMAWVAVLYTGVFATVVGKIWYCHGIDKIGAARAGMFINFVPVTGMLLGVLLLGEKLTASLCLGTLLVCTGVYLTSRRKA